MNVSFVKSAFREDHYPPADRPEIAFAGKSNVGKSSLINVLVNRKLLAKTSSQPGKTQAINFFDVNNRLYFVDLPGYGFARVPMKVKKSWGTMVEKYLSGRQTLKAVIVMLDIRRDISKGDIDILHWLRHYSIDSIVVLTKADKLSRQKARQRAVDIYGVLHDFLPEPPVIFSSKTRQGRDHIWKKIEEVVSRS
ncbi:MAG: YihA family ribosome biogenesis GTP-binding protein [Deltaproteobacteria bacterium]|nr:YihA family ribosome biogenesis GTP-binding protein [Deltaproteobacteria bacterium]